MLIYPDDRVLIAIVNNQEDWRRISFIVTTGDRFEAAEEIKDLYADQSPGGYPFVTLKEQQGAFKSDENHLSS